MSKQLPKSSIKGTIYLFAKVCQKTITKHYSYTQYIGGTNLSIEGSSTGHNTVVSSINLSFILQVLQDHLMLWIRRVIQLTILVSSTSKRRERNWQIWHNFGISVYMLLKFKKRVEREIDINFINWIAEIQLSFCFC